MSKRTSRDVRLLIRVFLPSDRRGQLAPVERQADDDEDLQTVDRLLATLKRMSGSTASKTTGGRNVLGRNWATN